MQHEHLRSCDKKALKEVERIFAEQVGWAVDAGVDYFVAETFSWGGEALLALAAIQKHSKVPAVVTMAMHREDLTRDDLTPVEVCQRLEAAGAQVVGINCHRGPATIMPMMRAIRKAVSCHVAALPVPYRTTPAQPSFMSLTDPAATTRALSRWGSIRSCARGRRSSSSGVRPSRLASTTWACAAAPGRTTFARLPRARPAPPASRYSVDMSRHAFFGNTERIKQIQIEYRGKL